MTACGKCNRKNKRSCPGCIDGHTGDRRDVSYHEAAHNVAAKHMGASRVRSKVHDRPRFWSGWLGETSYKLADGKRVEDAVVNIVGEIAEARANGRSGHAGNRTGDLTRAQRLLRGTGTSMKQAQAQAARFVDAHWAEIDRAARELYRRGRI